MAKPKSIITPTIVKASTEFETVPQQSAVVDDHINNKDLHIDQDLRDSINYNRSNLESHIENENIHVSLKEKDTWNNKESQQGAQSKANKVMSSLQNHMNDNTTHVTTLEKQIYRDKYTKSETRNLLKHTLTGLKFLKSVFNKSELEKKYPNPEFNSCVYLRESKTSVIYNGKEWVDFNLLFTPEVSEEFDGLMTSDDKKKLDTIEEGANNYTHPDNVDTRHVSDSEKEYWNSKADNVLVSTTIDGLMTFDDKKKLDTIEEGANNYTHPEKHDPSIIKQDKNNRFVSDQDKAVWNNKVDHEYMDESINKTLTTVKSMIDTKVANIFNTSEEQLQVLRSLAFELKNNDTVQRFIEMYNECIKSEEFKEHVLNDRIHLNRTDIALLENVKSLLESGLPDIKIPESLPANGGNADTVGGYKAEDLLNKKNFYDYIIEDVSVIEDIIFLLNNKKVYNILFKPGTYELNKELVIKANNTTIKGIGAASQLIGTTIKIIGNNNTIEDITLTSNNGSFIDRTAIIVEGDNNIIRNNNISFYDDGIVISGNNNRVIDNNLASIRRVGIRIESTTIDLYNNYLVRNDIKYSGTGIVLNSFNNKVIRNYVKDNTITSCTTGIILTNSVNNIEKTTMNIISHNFISKGNGDNSEYLPGHNTIVSEFASKNIISENITLGKEIHALHDILSNNIF